MIDWGRLAKANRRGVSQSRKKALPKKAAKAKPKTHKTPRIIHPKIIKPKVTKMSNEKSKPKPEPEKKATPEPEKKAIKPEAEKKEKYQEPIGQEVKSGVVKPSGAALERVKELEASTPEAIAAAREKAENKKK
jgi:hypothetical protein